MSADSTDISSPKRARKEDDDDQDDGNNEAMCQPMTFEDMVTGTRPREGQVPMVPVVTHPISSSTNGKDTQALDLSSHHQQSETSNDQEPLETSAAQEPVAASMEVVSVSSSIHTESSVSLNQIEFKRSLNEIASRKVTIFEGSYNGSPAVVMLEKTPFNETTVKSMIKDGANNVLNRDFVNDVYGKYNLYPCPELNGIKTTIIHPATDLHINKYLPMKLRMIKESGHEYKNITLPFITGSSFDITWVYNILDHKQESDRIVFEDTDPETGFILLPDLKWNDQTMVTDLYLVAIVHRRDLKSIRDLNSNHLPLLKNIRSKGINAIKEKYGLNESNLRIYLHYQPSYYHVHVHFTALSFEAPGCKVERAHLLDHVISNIELVPDYYDKATLTFCERENSKLSQLFDQKMV